MMRPITIEKKKIGDGQRCFVIAEAGSNHNGDYQKALALIDAAIRARADAVKFQTFRAEKLYLRTAGQSKYLKSSQSIFEIIKGMEMPFEWIPKLARYCHKKGIIFLSTPTDEACVDVLDPYVPAYKIASYELTAVPLVEHIAKKGKPVIISTGASDLDEVRQAIKVIRRAGNSKIAVMQCTASYPAPLTSLNLKAIPVMKRALGVPIGLSDHSREPDVAPMAAVALGASLIEKHFTLSNKLPGPDHRFAVEPDELAWMIEKIRAVESCMGTGIKKTLPAEQELRSFARRSIFATRDIRRGERFSEENIAVLRCGVKKGVLSPAFFKAVCEKFAARDIRCEGAIHEKDAVARCRQRR